jgi:hypothetical protein
VRRRKADSLDDGAGETLTAPPFAAFFQILGAGPLCTYIWSALTKDPDPGAYLTLSPEGVARLASGNSGATLARGSDAHGRCLGAGSESIGAAL